MTWLHVPCEIRAETNVTSRHDFLAWTWADQPCYRGSFTPWLPLAADSLTMFDARCCWRHVKTWRWKWRILDLLKAMPCLRLSLVLRKNDALRIGRKDFVELVFMISLDIVFCNAVVDAGETLRRLNISFSVRRAVALPDVIILARFFPFHYHKLLVECNDNISPYSSSVFSSARFFFHHVNLWWIPSLLKCVRFECWASISSCISHFRPICVSDQVWSHKYTCAVFHPVFECIQDFSSVIWDTCSVLQGYRVGIVVFTKLHNINFELRRNLSDHMKRCSFNFS